MLPLILLLGGGALAAYEYNRQKNLPAVTTGAAPPTAPANQTAPARNATINPEDGESPGQNVGTRLGSIPTPASKDDTQQTEAAAAQRALGLGQVDEFFGMAMADINIRNMTAAEIAATDPTRNMTADEKLEFERKMRQLGRGL